MFFLSTLQIKSLFFIKKGLAPLSANPLHLNYCIEQELFLLFII